MNGIVLKWTSTRARCGSAFFLILASASVYAAPPKFNPRVVIQREFPAITNRSNIGALEADEVLDDAELVIGVTVNGKSRAYPINMLNGPTREIINDELGGRPIAATW